MNILWWFARGLKNLVVRFTLGFVMIGLALLSCLEDAFRVDKTKSVTSKLLKDIMKKIDEE